MATSGYFDAKYSGDKNVYLRTNYEVKQNKEENYSRVYIIGEIRGSEAIRHWNNYDHNSWVSVNGVKKVNKKTHFDTSELPDVITEEGLNFKITHDADGYGKMKISAKHNSGVQLGTAYLEASTKTTVSLPRIIRVSKLDSVSASIDGLTAKYTKYVSSFTNTLVIKVGNFTKKVSKYTSGVKVTFTSAEKEKLYANVVDDKLTFKCYIETYNGSTLVGTSATKEVTITVETTNMYIKIDSSTIVKAKGVYIKTDSNTFVKPKSVYIKSSDTTINKS